MYAFVLARLFRRRYCWRPFCLCVCPYVCPTHVWTTLKRFENQHVIQWCFTALHWMQTRSSDENSVRPFVHPSVCPSVRLSVERVNCDKIEERFVQIFIPYERSFSLVFWEEEWLVRATPSTWNSGSTGPRWSEIANFEPTFAHSTSAVTPSEKSSINANRKSTTRFPMSLRWSSYVTASPSRGLKMQNGRFRYIIALHSKKVCYKVYLFENYDRQSCKAFIGLTIRAKMIGGRRLLLPEI